MSKTTALKVYQPPSEYGDLFCAPEVDLLQLLSNKKVVYITMPSNPHFREILPQTILSIITLITLIQK